MPLTRRLKSRRVQFVTGHDVTGGLPEELNFAALADPSATTAVFMGKRTFPELARRLIAAGLPADTPAMLAESIGHPDQQLSHTTVTKLAGLMADEDGTAPALILYGRIGAWPPLTWLGAGDNANATQ